MIKAEKEEIGKSLRDAGIMASQVGPVQTPLKHFLKLMLFERDHII